MAGTGAGSECGGAETGRVWLCAAGRGPGRGGARCRGRGPDG